MANPSPSVITDPIWRLWVEFDAAEPTVLLGGIIAWKPGYHAPVAYNQRNFPGNYSIRFSLDTKQGPDDKARAIDLTMSASLMKRYTQRLVNAAARNDPRMKGVREFYGTTNGSTVVGRIRDNSTSAYRSSTSDKTHLWHIHISFWAAFCNNWDIVSGVLSILLNREIDGDTMWLPQKGDKGPEVAYWQIMLQEAGYDLPRFGNDSDFGNETVAALNAFRSDRGWEPSNRITPWTAVRLQQKVFRGARGPAGKDGQDGARGLPGKDGKDGKDGTLPTEIKITGTATVMDATA